MAKYFQELCKTVTKYTQQHYSYLSPNFDEFIQDDFVGAPKLHLPNSLAHAKLATGSLLIHFQTVLNLFAKKNFCPSPSTTFIVNPNGVVSSSVSLNCTKFGPLEVLLQMTMMMTEIPVDGVLWLMMVSLWDYSRRLEHCRVNGCLGACIILQ